MTSYSKNLLLCDAVTQSLFFSRATKSIKLQMYLILRFIFKLHWILWWNFWCTRLIHFTSTAFFLIYFTYSWCTRFCDRNATMHLILRGSRIVSNIPQKQHTIPADVLPNDSEKLFHPATVKHIITRKRIAWFGSTVVKLVLKKRYLILYKCNN